MNSRILLASLAIVSVVPAFAQIDLAGQWAARLHQDNEDRLPGPEAVDYLGVPINAEARAKALAYEPSQIAMVERQCLYYNEIYKNTGPQALSIWKTTDPDTGDTVAWNVSAAIDRAGLTIWMDGRPHPPAYAPHPFGGFITGQWEGDVLTTYTTHMKAGYLRRNGLPSSDQATIVSHYRRHGDLLEITELVEDPAYLTEPYVISRVWQLDPRNNINPVPNPCYPAAEVPTLATGTVVPHYLPGKNTNISDLKTWYSIPEEAILGGAETAYPEYRKKLKAQFVQPEKCIRYCCSGGPNPPGGGPGNNFAKNLDCIGNGFAGH
jgi:hypothetical protein